MAAPLLSVRDLKTYFHTRNGVVRAVDGVSFDLHKGQTLGIVGESGSGKSVACHSLLRLIPQPPGKIEGGQALLDGFDLLQASEKELQKIRGRRISMIFQEPMTSLNPYLRIEDQLIEPLLIHERMPARRARRRAAEALEQVGISDAARRLRSYPHEFSGGMRQRVMIAMALITEPDLLIADEPTTALDVTVQAQILELIQRAQRELGMAVIFISHDLAVAAGFCQRALVMYAGRLFETASIDDLFYDPRHPYSQALQKSIPALQSKSAELYSIRGLPPDLGRAISGCPFAPRCDYAADYCAGTPIELKRVAPNHDSACLRVQRENLSLRPRE